MPPSSIDMFYYVMHVPIVFWFVSLCPYYRCLGPAIIALYGTARYVYIMLFTCFSVLCITFIYVSLFYFLIVNVNAPEEALKRVQHVERILLFEHLSTASLQLNLTPGFFHTME